MAEEKKIKMKAPAKKIDKALAEKAKKAPVKKIDKSPAEKTKKHLLKK
jgi:hypothetical protein